MTREFLRTFDSIIFVLLKTKIDHYVLKTARKKNIIDK